MRKNVVAGRARIVLLTMTYITDNIHAQDWGELNRLSIQFSQRLIQMTSASVQGFQQRLSRIDYQCNEKTAENFLALSGKLELAEIPISQVKLVSECSDFYIEEIRNGQQIAQLTFDEMNFWADRFTQTWSLLLGYSDPQLEA